MNKEELETKLNDPSNILIFTSINWYNEDITNYIRSINKNVEIIIINEYVENSYLIKQRNIFAYFAMNNSVDRIMKFVELVMLKISSNKPIILDSKNFIKINKINTICADESTKKMYKRASIISKKEGHILIFGETGSGKEYLARYLHENSLRKRRRFSSINASQIDKLMANSVLFGHKRGSFTGAMTDHRGIIELAHESTLFIDEIENLSLDVQARLLRTVQSGEFSKVGEESKTLISDVRFIAASNQPYENLLKDGQLREDLYFRFRHNISLLPLRERPKDLNIFIMMKIREKEDELKRPIYIEPTIISKLIKQHWSGNFRELSNFMDQLLEIADEEFAITEDNIVV